MVPLTFSTKSQPNEVVHSCVLDKKNATFQVPALPDDWVKVSYLLELLTILIPCVNSNIETSLFFTTLCGEDLRCCDIYLKMLPACRMMMLMMGACFRLTPEQLVFTERGTHHISWISSSPLFKIRPFHLSIDWALLMIYSHW